MKNKKLLVIAIVCLLIALGIISRFVNHPPNFVPLAAIALVSAYYFSSKQSWLIPLGIMLISDLFIGFYSPLIMLSVYGGYLAIWGLGRWAKSSESRFALVPAVLTGSVLFFLATNFAVWAFSPLYSKTIDGLYLAYAMGIPFFKWTLAGDVLYTIILVGIIEAARYAVLRKQEKRHILFNQAKY